MARGSFRAFLCAALVTVGVGGGGAGVAPAWAEEHEAAAPFPGCASHPDSRAGSAVLHVETVSGADEITRSRARIAWTQSDDELRVRLRMLAPAEVAGSTLLLIESRDEKPEAFAYLPEVDKVKRVGGRHLRKPLFGTTLTYADLARARGALEREDVAGALEAWGEEELNGRPVWRLEHRAGRERIVTWLDQERCVVLRSELTDRKGRLARRVEVSSEPALAAGPAFVPHALSVTDLLSHAETRIEVETIELERLAPPEFFEPGSLSAPSLHRLETGAELAARQ